MCAIGQPFILNSATPVRLVTTLGSPKRAHGNFYVTSMLLYGLDLMDVAQQRQLVV